MSFQGKASKRIAKAIWLFMALQWGVILWLAFPHQLLAISNPDSISVQGAFCWGEALETGDILCVLHYDIAYASLPTEDADEAFLGRYMQGGTVALRSTVPTVFVTQGYNQGVMSIYFSSQDVTTLGIVFGAATDTLQVIGSPTLFASPPNAAGAIDWGAQIGPKEEIETQIRVTANNLQSQTEWASNPLIGSAAGFSTQIFTTDGELYFTEAIPNLRVIAGGLFSIQAVSPEFVEDVNDFSYIDTLRNFWVGSGFEDTFTETASWTNVPEVTVKTGWGLMLMVAVAAITAILLRRWDIPENLVMGVVLSESLLTMVFLTLVGWIDPKVTFAIGGLATIVLAFIFFLRKA